MQSIQCADCFIDSCPMWRRTLRGLIVCNACHLKRVKAANNSSTARQQKDKKDLVRQSSRKSKPSAKLARLVNGKYLDKTVKPFGIKNRKSLAKKKPSKSPTVTADVVTSSSIYYQGLLFKEGDIVAVTDIGGMKYYAQLRGFIQDVFLNKSAIISWLLPTVPNPTRFDPAIFLPGPDEDTPRPMACFEFVSRAPTNLFRLRTSYPPFVRSKADLSSLLAVADDLLKSNDEDLPNNSTTVDGSS